MKSVSLTSGVAVPALGQGTWNMGDDRAARADELAALRLGLEHGLSLIDTAEMYGNGRSEELVGEAIAGQRDKAFIVSKVLPANATRRGTRSACEKSLARLKTDYIDLYLLHWRGSVPLAETLEAFIALQAAGKIRHWGVSNLGLDDMRELLALEAGAGVATNQLLYNLTRRGIEWDLLPWLRERHIPVMAYSPLEQARLVSDQGLKRFSARHGMSPAQAALAWLLGEEDVIVIPKTSSPARMRENLGCLEHPLSTTQRAELERLFPAPGGPRPLEML